MPRGNTKRRQLAALYVRVSTVRQAARELSIPDQIRHLREHCEQNDIDVVDVFEERGASGRDESRPEFQKMMTRACARDRPYDLLLVHSFSRFARDKYVLEGCCRELAKFGVRLDAVTQSVEDSAEGRMVRGFYGLIDEYASEQISKHVTRGMLQVARDGYWPGSHAPDGFRKVAAREVGDKIRYVLAPDPIRADVIVNIFNLALNGNGAGPMGVKAIVNWLNERGIKSSRGSRWGTGSVHRVLSSETCLGRHFFNKSCSRTKTVRPREEWILVSSEPIVDLELFEAVNRNLKARSPNKMAPRLPGSPMLLTGIVQCGCCGAAMTQMTGKGGQYIYYACSNRRRTGIGVCDGRSVRKEIVEDMVCNALAERVLAVEHIDGLVAACVQHARAQSDVDERTQKAKKVLAEAELAFRRVYEGVTAGVLDPTEPILKEQLDGLKLRRVEAEDELGRCKALKEASSAPPSAEKIKEFSADLGKRISEGDVPLRKAYIRAFVAKITILKDEIVISGSKEILASAASRGNITPQGGVLSFVPKWRSHGDSNPGYIRERDVS